jgi:hemerythrin superfamily protein
MDNQLAVDHADLGELLAEVRTALEAGDIKRSHARLDLFWARLAMHIRAEHLHLFPAILGALNETPKVNAGTTPSLSQALDAIEQLRRDHDFFMHELARAIATMRHLLTSSDQRFPARDLEDVNAQIIAVAERLATHNALEETHVYLWVKGLLNDEEQAELEMLMHRELGNLPLRFNDKANPN